MNDDEAKNTVKSILKELYKNPNNIPHREHTPQEINDIIEDSINIQLIIQRIIIRRDARNTDVDN